MALVGLVTCPAYPELTDDNRLLVEPMRAHGMDAVAVEWDAGVDWGRFDALLIRQTWDYWDREKEFRAWLDERNRSGPPMWNQPATLHWNLNKGYLRELAAGDVSVVDTAWIPKGATTTLRSVMDERGWDRVVVKPAVSAGGFRTFAVREPLGPKHEKAFAELLAQRELIVQPFLDTIVTQGEWSLVFFDGTFEYSLIKRAAPGEFRVQDRFGGTATIVEAPPELIEQARNALRPAPGDLLYARVDGIWDGSRFTVLELEIFEPVLFFGLVTGSAARLAQAISKRLGPA